MHGTLVFCAVLITLIGAGTHTHKPFQNLLLLVFMSQSMSLPLSCYILWSVCTSVCRKEKQKKKTPKTIPMMLMRQSKYSCVLLRSIYHPQQLAYRTAFLLSWLVQPLQPSDGSGLHLWSILNLSDTLCQDELHAPHPQITLYKPWTTTMRLSQDNHTHPYCFYLDFFFNLNWDPLDILWTHT